MDFKVAVVLINYGNLDDTIACIKSIQDNSTGLPFIVVVENDSKDKIIIAQQLEFYPHLKVIINQKNLGFAKANNVGIDWLYGNINFQYLFILNNDTIVKQDAINKLAEQLDKSADSVAMAAPLILVYDTGEVWYAGGSFNYSRITPDVFKDIDQLQPISPTDFASGCAMMFKKKQFAEIGAFDPFFFMYDEDVELSMRTKAKNFQIKLVLDAVILHKCQGSQTKSDNIPSNQLHPNHPSLLFYLKNTIVNRRYIIQKYLTGSKKIKSSATHTIYWLMKSTQYLVYGKVKAAFSVLNYLFLKLIKNQ